MAERLDLTSLPYWSYWRAGVPDLIATERELCIRAMLDLMDEKSLKVELTIEGIQIDPQTFVDHLHEWTVAHVMVLQHGVLDPILDQLECGDGPQGLDELRYLARWLRDRISRPGPVESDDEG